MKRVALLALLLAGCAAASGYDAKRYGSSEAGAPDPEATALPPAARTTIPDPKKPAAPKPAPAPAAASAGM